MSQKSDVTKTASQIPAEGKPKRRGMKKGGHKTMKSVKAGLVFPVGRFQRLLREGRYAERVSPGGAVFLAAVIEYLCAEVMEISGNAAKEHKRKTIAPRHIMISIRSDEELDELTNGATFSQAGMPVRPIHPSLLPKKTDSQETSMMAD